MPETLRVIVSPEGLDKLCNEGKEFLVQPAPASSIGTPDGFAVDLDLRWFYVKWQENGTSAIVNPLGRIQPDRAALYCFVQPGQLKKYVEGDECEVKPCDSGSDSPYPLVVCLAASLIKSTPGSKTITLQRRPSPPHSKYDDD